MLPQTAKGRRSADPFAPPASARLKVPPNRMADHKIQSTDAADAAAKNASKKALPDEEEEAFDNFDSSPAVPRSKRLVIDLDPVPKFLKNLVDDWAVGCMSAWACRPIFFSPPLLPSPAMLP